jgi:PleD family two-component response regulator
MNEITILIVTKDLNTKYFFKNALVSKFNLIEKKEKNQAIEIAENTDLDVVIIDEKIENAIDLCFQLKKRKRLFITPIILITSSLKKSYMTKAKNAGVFDFLYTPLNEGSLFYLLDKCFEEEKRLKKIKNISFNLKNPY